MTGSITLHGVIRDACSFLCVLRALCTEDISHYRQCNIYNQLKGTKHRFSLRKYDLCVMLLAEFGETIDLVLSMVAQVNGIS